MGWDEAEKGCSREKRGGWDGVRTDWVYKGEGEGERERVTDV